MKKYILFIMICMGVFCSATAQNKDSKLSSKDSTLFYYLDAYLAQLREPEYKLYPTENNWIFLRLNTRTGQIWMVQYSIDDSPRMIADLDISIKTSTLDNQICGRYILQPTKNMYNFIMLDQINGRCWQVQWSIDPENRGVLRIY